MYVPTIAGMQAHTHTHTHAVALGTGNLFNRPSPADLLRGAANKTAAAAAAAAAKQKAPAGTVMNPSLPLYLCIC